MQESLRQQIIPRPLEEEMKDSYIDYSMSVIVGRALPDVRDGLKPVHRRIIYAMRELGLHPNRPYMKCARIVGETMGKYHPHGDAAIYDALVRMAQDFSSRYVLIDGQGNFGSIDGDPPAAYRYTEARLAPLAEAMLADIDKDTVDFRPNYDGKNVEPVVLPSAIPNLLINGSSGIAVGMATNIPPHNLREVIDGIIAYIDNPEISVDELMECIPGPDFPTGAFIIGKEQIKKAYTTGRGRIVMRSRIVTEQLKGGREAIVVTEIPYQINKSKILEEIAQLVQQKKITGVSDLRDESDREGIRIVIEAKRGEPTQVIINHLLKHTSLETAYSIILLALVNNQPAYLPLPKMIHYFVEHRKEVVVRRTKFELRRAEQRLHIVEGLKKAVDQIDLVIKLIRQSKTTEEAKEKLMSRLALSEVQAQAILDMRLQRLTGLEIQNLKQELSELKKTIKSLKEILDSPQKVLDIVKEELRKVQEQFGDERRTEIIEAAKDLTIEDLIAEENVVITVSHSGYIKRTPTTLYRRQHRGGKGLTGMETKQEDWVEHLFVGTTHNYILFFTNKGRAYWLKVYELPQGGRTSKGRPIVNLLNLEEGETIEGMIPVARFDAEQYLIFATRNGYVVKNSLALYSNPRRTGIKAIEIPDDDELIDVKLSHGKNDVFIATRRGLAIRFHESEIRPMGRGVRGVIGIRLMPDDEVIGLEICRPNSTILTVCEKGYGKRTSINDYRITHRGGKGVINIKVSERNGNVLGIKEVIDTDELIMITQKGKIIRIPVSGIRVISRNTQGVRLIQLDEDDHLTGMERIAEKNENMLSAEIKN
ncbi:DNA gyrase subunit A [Candidatus Sumerlaeota bacterium]|nr:DNA gyrase subunit A [Candidatus Sumerlaeota bacterium]